MDPRIAATLDRFAPLSLETLNARAAMLERLDHKYIAPAERLAPALERLVDLFDVLEIGGRRSFTYVTTYFDDPDRRAYHDHHQGRRKRCKIRVRDYVDAGFRYLEIKLKDRRDATVKKRLRLAREASDAGGPDVGGLDAEGLAFLDACHREMYDEPFDRPLTPVIRMAYERITLVARAGGERMTLDTGLRFEVEGRAQAVRPGLFIVETKSRRGAGLADTALRGLHLHPTQRCSKYCIGMAATGQVARRNRFLPALRRLGLLGVPANDALSAG
jgi:hypothetical protein